MSYDMTLGNAGYGFGGSSGLGGFLGNLGNAWQSGLSNNLRMATDLYNFTNKSLTDPSAVEAKIAQNVNSQEQLQRERTKAYYDNQMMNLALRLNSGTSANDLMNRPNTQSQVNQQVQMASQPVNQSPSTTPTTAYSQQQQIGPYRAGYQMPQNNQQVQFTPQLLQQMLSAPNVTNVMSYAMK